MGDQISDFQVFKFYSAWDGLLNQKFNLEEIASCKLQKGD